jgi:drug/metabolite transporter (DMT)-like permease
MLAAFLATWLFAFSVVFASRTTRVLGSFQANLFRLLVATVFLGLWAHLAGGGLGGGGVRWFFLSGCIGFGIGDLALYLCLPRVGPRLAGLLIQCLAPPFAAVAEWLWMETLPGVRQLGAGVIILVGVGLAVAPGRGEAPTEGARAGGVGLGGVAAMGQGLGAVVSRKAYTVVELAGGQVDGLTAAYQRILGGLLIAVPVSLVFLARERLLRRGQGGGGVGVVSMDRVDSVGAGGGRGRRRVPVGIWVLLNALAGPALGVGCYQWALATTPSAVVLPIVATMPILVIPLAWAMEGDRPSGRAVTGGVVAVLGAVLMAI